MPTLSMSDQDIYESDDILGDRFESSDRRDESDDFHDDEMDDLLEFEPIDDEEEESKYCLYCFCVISVTVGWLLAVVCYMLIRVWLIVFICIFLVLQQQQIAYNL